MQLSEVRRLLLAQESKVSSTTTPRASQPAALSSASAAVTRAEIEREAIAAGASPTPALVVAWDWLAAECAKPPVIQVAWARPGSVVATLPGRAFFCGRPMAIVIPPIVGEAEVATAGHELGHGREGIGFSQLMEEILAWTWTIEHLPFWTRTTHDLMRRYLAGYVANDPKDNKSALRLALADELASEETLARHQKSLDVAVSAAERAAVSARFGGGAKCRGRLCAGRELAVRILEDRPLCGRCADNALIDRSIAEMRALRASLLKGNQNGTTTDTETQ